jgi:hypothetical protein
MEEPNIDEKECTMGFHKGIITMTKFSKGSQIWILG